MTHELMDAVLTIDDGPNSVNFYRDSSDAEGTFLTTAAQRRSNLLGHLKRVASGDLVLVGEAAGWMGARQSGVAFTSAANLGLPGDREAAATVVQNALQELDLVDRALLWNAFPIHPHDTANPRSNRTPLAAELGRGRQALALAVQGRRVICVGNKAAESMQKLTGQGVASVWDAPESEAVLVRHPSFGGGPKFLAGLRAAMR